MTTQTNHHSSITFFCPNHLKVTFDELVKFKRVSRTSIINHLMEQWMRKEYRLMNEDNEMVSFINDLKVRNHKNPIPKITKSNNDQRTKWSSQKDDYEPPMIPTINEDYSKDNWDDVSGTNRLFENL